MVEFLYTNYKFKYRALLLTDFHKQNAEDVIQNTALNLLRYHSLEEYQLKKIAWVSIRNFAINIKRRKIYDDWMNYNLPIPSFENEFINKDMLRKAYLKIMALPSPTKDLFLDFTENGIEAGKLSLMYSMKESKVYNQIHKVRKILRA